MSRWSEEQLQEAAYERAWTEGYAYRKYEESLYELLDLEYQNSLIEPPTPVVVVFGEVIEGVETRLIDPNF
jgi:hypothetical protein